MKKNSKIQSILVISGSPDLAQTVRQIEAGQIEVTYAPGKTEGLARIRELHPEIVVLGDLGPVESVLGYYRELREGWISRHSSLLLIEEDAGSGGFRILGDEHLSSGIGTMCFHTGKPGATIPRAGLAGALTEIISLKLRQRENRLRASVLDSGCFCLTWEQIPGLGAFEIRQELVLENARKAAAGGQVCAISIVDNPGGNPAIATEILCSEIRKQGIEPMVHLAFRDRNRNQVESLLYQLAALDINNLLILTGDYPSNIGFEGTARPVFDLDAVNGLQLISEMNNGMEHEIMRRKTRLAPTEFFAGAAFTPFKSDEGEVMGQYYKLRKKIAAGADFAITQIGFDARKLHELQLWLKQNEYALPVLTSIQVLSHATAKAMHDHRVPGAVVTDKLLAQTAAEAAAGDRGRAASLERAAKMYAISAGMGFKGACLSGQWLTYDNVEYVIRRGNELKSGWMDLVKEFDYPQKDGFYLYERDPETGLNLPAPSSGRQRPSRPPVYFFSAAVHRSVFEPESPLFKPVQWLASRVDRAAISQKMVASLEYWTKAVIYGCKDCGDCGLFDVAYLCPVSQCPKNQRNGPCGGSYEGWCEVYPGEKKCIWVRAYRRLPEKQREHFMGDYIVPPCNWGLWQTSSWLNYFLGRDHVAKRAGIKDSSNLKSQK
jgi:methylenetetrahydrofolate reductase (NADPH)